MGGGFCTFQSTIAIATIYSCSSAMASYNAMELRIIEAAKKSLAEDKEKARRTRMLAAGIESAEIERRIAQSRASREAHFRVLADPERSEELAQLSKAQSEAARRSAGTADRLKPDHSGECEGRTMAYIRQHGPAPALAIARAVSEDEAATKAYINPTLYRLAARGEVVNTERGWTINHTVLKAQILSFLDDVAYNVLELCALLGSNVERTKAALEEMVDDGSITTTHFNTPSGEHVYYSKLSD